MKKLLLLFTFLLFAFNSYGFGIGVEGGYSGLWASSDKLTDYTNGHVGLSMGFGSYDDPKGFMGIRYNVQKKGWGIGFYHDIPFVHKRLNSWLYFFVAAGAGLDFAYRNKTFNSPLGSEKLFALNLDITARLPVGLRFVPLRFLEVFVEFDPSIGFGMSFGHGNIEVQRGETGFGFGLVSGLSGTMGIRFWL